MAATWAITEEQILATYPLMKQLRPHLVEEDYVSRIMQQQADGYKLLVIFEEGEAKAAAGYRFGNCLAWGKFMYVDDLITDQENRSKGYAKQLFDRLEEEAAAHQCSAMHLDSGVHRHDAHRFYLNRKMIISSHHFEKSYLP